MSPQARARPDEEDEGRRKRARRTNAQMQASITEKGLRIMRSDGVISGFACTRCSGSWKRLTMAEGHSCQPHRLDQVGYRLCY